jgi:hypothetical protein
MKIIFPKQSFRSGHPCWFKRSLMFEKLAFKSLGWKILSAESLYALPLYGYRCAVDSQERYSMLKSDYEKGEIKFQK